jgi:hypothetical protein
VRWASSLPDGLEDISIYVQFACHQAKCLLSVGTKTMTVTFLEGWEGVATDNQKRQFITK